MIKKIKKKAKSYDQVIIKLKQMQAVRLFQSEIEEMEKNNFHIKVKVAIFEEIINIKSPDSTYYSSYTQNIINKEVKTKKTKSKNIEMVEDDNKSNLIEKSIEKEKVVLKQEIKKEPMIKVNFSKTTNIKSSEGLKTFDRSKIVRKL
jgi:hypothetical protein